jgi:hypothetical protein
MLQLPYRRFVLEIVMPRKKPVENAGTAAAARRRANAARMIRGRAADVRGSRSRGRGDSSGYTVTSASGTPGPSGVLTTGHYSPNGQRMYGGYSSTSGKPNPPASRPRTGDMTGWQLPGAKRRPDTPDAQASIRRRRRLPGTR